MTTQRRTRREVVSRIGSGKGDRGGGKHKKD
jgi:hypothetical protein